MERKTGAVAHLASTSGSTTGGVSSSTSNESDATRRERKLAFTRALVIGLSRLIEGQRQFADEFGLSLNRVFPNSYKSLEGNTPMQLAISLFKDDWNTMDDLNSIFNDLVMHQVALFSALDGVACEAIAQLGEDGLGDVDSKLNDARAWRLHKERLDELASNPGLRFEKMVVTGFMNSYVRTLEKHRVVKKPENYVPREKDNEGKKR